MPHAALKPRFMKGSDWKSETFEPSRDWTPGRGANQLPWPHSIRLATGGEFHVGDFPDHSLLWPNNSLFRRVGNLPEISNQFSSLWEPRGPKQA